MIRAASIVGALAAGLGAFPSAAPAETASGSAHVSIVDAPGVGVNWALAMPSVRGGASGATFQGTLPSMGLGMMMPGSAALLIRREDQAGQPVTAPTSFEVVTTRGEEALTIRTGGTPDLRLGGDGAIVGGALLDGAAASIEVGRGLILASSVPRPDSLMVVVQYN